MAESSAADFTVGKIQKDWGQRVAKMYGQQKRNIIHTSSTAYEQDHSAATHNPRTRRGSCCNLMDCRPTQSRMVGDHCEVKVDGAWTPVPYDKINNVVAPDGTHLSRSADVSATIRIGAFYFASFCRSRADRSNIALPAAPREAAIAAFPRSRRGIGNGQADDDTQPTGPRDFVLRRDRHAPTKYELVINLKTAKALGLEVPT